MIVTGSHTERAHALLAPSAGSRWMKCPASIARTATEENKSSSFAKEGTAAHQVCEHVMLEDVEPNTLLGGVSMLGANIDPVRPKHPDNPKPDGDRVWLIDHEMVESVEIYRGTLLDLIRPGFIVLYERRVSMRHVHRHLYGTVDAIVYDPVNKKLWIVDFKYGAGIPVDAIGNTQLLLYAIGAAHEFGYRIDKVEIVIVQPRAYHYDGPVRRWEIDALELIEFEGFVFDKAHGTDLDNAQACAGQHCQFCPAAYRCLDLRAEALRIMKLNPFVNGTFDGHDMLEVSKLSQDEMGRLYMEVSIVEMWVKRVKERAYEMALNGQMPTGMKLVEGRSTRKFKDNDAVAEELGALGYSDDDVYERKLKTVAQLEAAIGKKDFKKLLGDYVEKTKGKPTLVPIEDRRDAVNLDRGKLFGAVEEEDQ